MKSCVVHLTKKTKFQLPLKLSLLHGSRLKSAMASPQHLAHNILIFIKIGSFGGVIAQPAA